VAARGPNAATYERASAADLVPHKITDTLAFMFETRLPIAPSQRDYDSYWQGFPKRLEQ
jgi:homogentisate 1,2-dioxygenase